MWLTLVLLLAWLQIYCNSVVLSLPPSLIANAASWRQLQRQPRLQQQQHPWQQQQQQQRAKEHEQQSVIPGLTALWKKDNVEYGNSNNNNNKNNNDVASDSIAQLASNRGGFKHAHEADQVKNRHPNNNNVRQQRLRLMPLYRTSAAAAPIVRGSNNNMLGNEYQMNPLLLPTSIEHGAENDEEVLDAAEEEQATEEEEAAAAEEQKAQDVLAAELSNALVQSQSTSPPAAAAAIASRIREIEWNDFFSPLNYWARHCQPAVDDDCPEAQQQQEQRRQQRLQRPTGNSNIALSAIADMLSDGAAPTTVPSESIDDTILMLLNGQQDLTRFLHWAMAQMQPLDNNHSKYVAAPTDRAYASDWQLWKKLNLSGQMEPVLMVDEPHYLIVRREPTVEDMQQTPPLHTADLDTDPFIPPRGRKYNNIPQLDKLLMQRYETFVPNRGKRDKIKDIFKYDDLFFPNRGKKRADLGTDELDYDADDDDDDDVEDARNSWTTLATAPTTNALRSRQHWLNAMRRRQQAAIINGRRAAADCNNVDHFANNHDDQTDKINGGNQSVKPSMTTTATAMSTAKRQQRNSSSSNNKEKIAHDVANSLQTTRSMSTMQQLQQQKKQLEQRQQHHAERQQLHLPAAVQQWLLSTKFKQQQLTQQQRQQHEQLLLQQEQHPLMLLPHLKLLQRVGARQQQLSPETQLVANALDI